MRRRWNSRHTYNTSLPLSQNEHPHVLIQQLEAFGKVLDPLTQYQDHTLLVTSLRRGVLTRGVVSTRGRSLAVSVGTTCFTTVGKKDGLSQTLHQHHTHSQPQTLWVEDVHYAGIILSIVSNDKHASINLSASFPGFPRFYFLFAINHNITQERKTRETQRRLGSINGEWMQGGQWVNAPPPPPPEFKKLGIVKQHNQKHSVKMSTEVRVTLH